MSLDTFKEIITKLDTSTMFSKNLFLAGFGESTLNEDFWDMIRFAKLHGYYLTLPTNGTTLDTEMIKKMRMIDQVQLSVDSLLINEKLRDNTNNVLDFVPLFKKYRVGVQINVTLGTANIEEVPRFLHYGIRESLPIYFMLTTPFNNKNKYLCDEFKSCIANLNKINHYISQYHCNAAVDIGCTTFNQCRYRGKDLSISSSGDIFPCNDALLKEFSFGNITEFDNFDEVMMSNKIESVADGKHPICNFCKSLDTYREIHYTPTFLYDKRIDEYKDKHKNHRCFVLGTGPSLTEELIDELRDEITIGVNQIYFAKDMWGFEPTYYNFADSNAVVNEEYFNRIKDLKSVKFYSEQVHYQAAINQNIRQISKNDYKDLERMIPVNWINPSLHINSLIMPNQNLISFDLRRGTLESGTVIQALSIPLAAWMGCSEIYLVGCDCSDEGHFYKKEQYWKVGPDIIRQYGWLNHKLKEEGKTLYNLSPSQLPYITNMNIEEVKSN